MGRLVRHCGGGRKAQCRSHGTCRALPTPDFSAAEVGVSSPAGPWGGVQEVPAALGGANPYGQTLLWLRRKGVMEPC